MVIKFQRFAFTFRYQYVSLDWLRFHFFVSVIFISASLFINLFVLHGQFFFPPPTVLCNKIECSAGLYFCGGNIQVHDSRG